MFEDWWHRVFGRSPAEPDPAAFLEHLQRQGFEVSGNFRGDDQGWFAAEITFADGAAPMQVERYLSAEEGIRADVNAWAAWAESLADDEPHAERLMQHLVRTAQVFTLRQPVRVGKALRSAPLCWEACRFLARATDGVFHVDGQGFFDADGGALIAEGV